MRGNLHDSRFIVREAGVFRTFLFDFIYPHNSYLVSGIPQINVAADKNTINDPGGGDFKNFWLGMCRWDPGTLNLYQS